MSYGSSVHSVGKSAPEITGRDGALRIMGLRGSEITRSSSRCSTRALQMAALNPDRSAPQAIPISSPSRKLSYVAAGSLDRSAIERPTSNISSALVICRPPACIAIMAHSLPCPPVERESVVNEVSVSPLSFHTPDTYQRRFSPQSPPFPVNTREARRTSTWLTSSRHSARKRQASTDIIICCTESYEKIHEDTVRGTSRCLAQGTYHANYQRLAEIKKRYGPTNLFPSTRISSRLANPTLEPRKKTPRPAVRPPVRGEKVDGKGV